MEEIAPSGQDVIFRQCAIVGFELDAHFQFVEVAAWFEIVIALRVERGPIADRAIQGADIDEVKGLRVRPRKSDIIYLKLAVRRSELGLNGGEVNAKDLGARVFYRWS